MSRRGASRGARRSFARWERSAHTRSARASLVMFHLGVCAIRYSRSPGRRLRLARGECHLLARVIARARGAPRSRSAGGRLRPSRAGGNWEPVSRSSALVTYKHEGGAHETPQACRRCPRDPRRGLTMRMRCRASAGMAPGDCPRTSLRRTSTCTWKPTSPATRPAHARAHITHVTPTTQCIFLPKSRSRTRRDPLRCTSIPL